MWFFPKRQAPMPKEDVESTDDAPGRNAIKRSAKFNKRHVVYLLCRDAIPGMVISAAINMAISYVMYVEANTQPAVYLFRLPKTLAGDAAVTILVHCVATWFLKFHLVHYDLQHGLVQPIEVVDDQPFTEDVCWLMFLSTEKEATTEDVRMNSIKWVTRHAIRALAFALLFLLAFWPISLIPLIMVGDREGNDFMYHRMWTPQIFKTTLGGVLGFMTSPVLSMLWLMKYGWEANHKR
ncbi:hypothetical protein E4U43_005148 [Claviceps pusilla]|uniref:Uncharacterized protein n=1 Tax=Claviceps pusilla TaxID=123648 RepID=A0A9P7N4K7_9HYPO|nr:hypothetical protein E4U43_005148 [Claviceps pusilla]